MPILIENIDLSFFGMPNDFSNQNVENLESFATQVSEQKEIYSFLSISDI